MNEEDIFNKFKMNVAVSNFKNESKNKHTLKEEIDWRKNDMKKKIIAIACGLVLVISGGVFAYNKIITSFKFGDGIDTAAQHGYIAKTDMNYISSDTIITDEKTNITLDNINIDARIEDFVMDDITIATHFEFEFDTKIKEVVDIKNLKHAEIKDLIVTDEDNNILYCKDKDSFERYCSKENLDYKYGEFNEHYYNCGLNIVMDGRSDNTLRMIYNIYTDGNDYPKCKELNFDFGKIKLETQDKEIILNGNWLMKFDVPEEFYNRTSIAYRVVSCENPDFNVTNATLTNTGFEIGINISNMPKPDLSQFIIPYDTLNPVKVWDSEDKFKNFDKITYVENEKGEKFPISMSAGRRQDSNYKDENTFHFYETFTLTKYDATDKLKVRVMFKYVPYIIELEKVK